MAALLSFFRADLLAIIFLVVVLFDGASLEEINSRSRRGFWQEVEDPLDDQYDDTEFSELSRSVRQNGIQATFPPPSDSTSPSAFTNTETDPDPSSYGTFSTSMSPPPLPNPSPDPNDKCGTSMASPPILLEPSRCFFNDTCSNHLCMQDFSLDILYSCFWSATENISNVPPPPPGNTTSPPPITVEVPGNCQPNNTPPAFANTSLTPIPSCFFHPVAHILTGNATKCICTEWDGSCPEEKLETCERDQLMAIANEMIRNIMEISEYVQPGCPCDYELEQKLPLAIQAVKQKRNLYRANMLLFQAKEKHICNRRRLMTCQPDGKCGCAPGTSRREYQGEDIKIFSYYCYAVQGHCDEDPVNVIEQFKPAMELVRRHYGDPREPTHKEPITGCLLNLLGLAKDPFRKFLIGSFQNLIENKNIPHLKPFLQEFLEESLNLPPLLVPIMLREMQPALCKMGNNFGRSYYLCMVSKNLPARNSRSGDCKPVECTISPLFGNSENICTELKFLNLN
ncbi:unnamed protein product [Orchesella dallaii]|uniref:Uncharacterized protein n=1 Tax=Orchesella dallaii TaxID=48710 RepID=A0ABP1S186_9HEXA